MIVIDNILVSDSIIEKQFVCDLAKCKGGCCEDGDAGAPLDEGELDTVLEIYEQVKPYLSANSIDSSFKSTDSGIKSKRTYDGRPDIIVTVLPREIYGVYHNDGNGLFSYRSLETGLGALSSGSSGWGVGLEDFDNDGWKDLFVAQSHVLDNVEKIDPSLHYLEPPMFALNHNGRFERADLGTVVPVAGRGAAFGDLNNDGWMDVVTSVLGGHPQVFLNRGGSRHWLVVSLRGTRSNRDGFGARVRVNGQTRFATTAGSYLSASDKRLHFGLGAAETAQVEILWPSGIRQTLNNVRADQFLEVREPEKP